MNKLYINALRVMVGILAIIMLPACNSKSEREEYVPASDVAVTKFSLKADKNVASNLDSLFFSLDLNNGLIYNADSLPVGSDVSKLIPVITLPASVKEATLVMEGGTVRNGEVNYLKNPSDSIDFTGQVTLNLLAEDGVTSKSYRIKVNVHLMEPDSLWWNKMAVANLPSRMPSPRNQKSVSFDSKIYTLICENDGSYTISDTDSPDKGNWNKNMAAFTFVPDVRSFSATEDALYILSEAGDLYVSPDGMHWNSTGKIWLSIIGGYGKKLSGIRCNGTIYMHTLYPLDDYVEKEADAAFPVKNSSEMVAYSSKWGMQSIGLITGGKVRSGELSGYTWAFDGAEWTRLSNNMVTPTEGGVMIPYFTFLRNSSTNVLSEHSIMLYACGKDCEGKLNRKIWISYSNGVNWTEAPATMAWPEYVPSMWLPDYAVVDTHMEANFTPEVWKTYEREEMKMKRYVTYTVDGYNVSWNCPYIYLFGGCNEEGTLYNSIWKGVLNRLSFKPIM